MINYSIGKAYNPTSESYFYRAYAQYTDLMDLGHNHPCQLPQSIE